MRKVQRTQIHGNDEGASAVEYGLLIAAVAAVIVVVIFALGGVVSSLFKNTCNSASSAASIAGQSC